MEYKPIPPDRLYGVKSKTPCFGNKAGIYGIEDNFKLKKRMYIWCIDRNGYIRLSTNGNHPSLVNNEPVGGAGRIVCDDEGLVHALKVNFTGHYQIPWSEEYEEYVVESFKRCPYIEMREDVDIVVRNFYL